MIAANQNAAITLRGYYQDTYRPCRLVGRSPRTLEAYDTSLTLWSRWPGTVLLTHIDTRTMAHFAEWLLPGRSPTSVNSYVKPLMAILRHAENEDDIGRVPKYRKLKEPKRVPLALTECEFLSILSVVDHMTGPRIHGIRRRLWWRSLLCVDWETGLRITALLSVRMGDVLLDQDGLYCQAEQQKDREADWFPLSPATMGLVRLIHDPRRELLWPMDVCPKWLRQQFRDIFKRSGIYAPKGAGMAFHRIRRSTASYIAAAGGEARAIACTACGRRCILNQSFRR